MAKRERRGGLQGDKGHFGYKHGLRGGKGKLWDKVPPEDDEVSDPNDWRVKIGTGPHPHPRGFKKGGSVKGHGSGLARRKRR